MALSTKNVLVVVPLFNEIDTIRQVVSEILRLGYRCIVVDDGSTDGSYEAAKEFGVAVLRLPFNCGVGAALQCGFRFAIENHFDAIVQCDADGQHAVSQISRLLVTANRTAADMVIGSRFLLPSRTFPVGNERRIVMIALAALVSTATKLKITDSTSGFRLISNPLLKEFATRFPHYYLGDTYEAILTAGRSGYKIQETAVSMHPRPIGTSKTSTRRAFAMLLKVLILTITQSNFKINRAN